MRPERKSKGVFVSLFFSVLCLILLAGCDTIGLTPPSMDLGANWVSTEGKSRDQFHNDQAECRRDITMSRTPTLAGPGGMSGDKWDVNDIRGFESCMRAKGWKKQ